MCEQLICKRRAVEAVGDECVKGVRGVRTSLLSRSKGKEEVGANFLPLRWGGARGVGNKDKVMQVEREGEGR